MQNVVIMPSLKRNGLKLASNDATLIDVCMAHGIFCHPAIKVI